MKVGFIGAGKVGTAIGCYFFIKGINVAGYFSRSMSSAVQASKLTQSMVYTSLDELAKVVDIIFVSVPDDTIKAVAQALSLLPVDWNTKVVIHLSGALTSDVLWPLAHKGATVSSLHPMLSFGDIDTAVGGLRSTHFTLEGKGILLGIIEELMNECGNLWTFISTENKVLYHAAACIMSNYLVTLLDTGLDILQTAGFEREEAIQLARPLVQMTVDNVMHLGTERALTGPISRGDLGTLEKHIDKLKIYSNNWLEIYKILGLNTVELADKAKKVDEAAVQKMKEVLSKHE